MRLCYLPLLLLGLTAAAPRVPVCERPRPLVQAGEQPFAEEVQRALEALLQAELAREPHAGLAVGVIHGPHRWVAGYGLRDLERRLPATPRTTWRMASITKSFTAVAVLQLVEQGRLQLDADIRAWVPSFPARRWPVTVRQLLGHLGGVPHYSGSESRRDTGPLDTAGALALITHKELVAEPGTRFVYSTWAYNLLGAAIENASGQAYADYLRQHVFAPAGMEHAALDRRDTRDEHHAAGYRLREGVLVPSRVLDVSGRFAGGGTRASVEDLLGFARGVLEYRLVSTASAGMMQASMSTREGQLTDYGMGFATWPHRGRYIVAHAGAQPETSTLLVLLPAESLAVVLASNVEGQGEWLRKLSRRIISLLLEGGAPRRESRPVEAVDAVVYEAMERIHNHGLAWHQWATRGPGRLPEGGEVSEAFREVAALLERAQVAKAPGAALERIRAAHEPRSGWLFVRVGAHMARVLEESLGPERLRAYPVLGARAFFADYLAVCESRSCPGALRFTGPLRAELLRLSQVAEGAVPAVATSP